MPLSLCSAIWQCAIRFHGLDMSMSMSVYSQGRVRTVSFHTKLSFLIPSFSKTKNLCPWKWIGCCMGCNQSQSLMIRTLTTSPWLKDQSSIIMLTFPVSSSTNCRLVVLLVEVTFIANISLLDIVSLMCILDTK